MSLTVLCLCAEWCGTCRDFHPAFSAVAGQWPDATFLWADIETHEDLLDELGIDIENFPTVLVATAEQAVVFAGPVTPFADTLQRICRTAAAGDLPQQAPSAWEALLARLRAAGY